MLVFDLCLCIVLMLPSLIVYILLDGVVFYKVFFVVFGICAD